MRKTAIFMAMALVAMTGSVNAQQVLGGAKAAISLSIGIKGADRQPDVDFEVVQPGGDRSTATAKAPYNGERPGTVSYPDDFTNAGMHPGTYRWAARANGRTIASGTFKYVATKGGLQTFSPF